MSNKAEFHAGQAERYLDHATHSTGQMVSNFALIAQVHATLATYYGARGD
jgi:hypothetical protein